MANFRANSRYTNGKVTTNRLNKTFLILRKPIKLEEDSTDTFIEVDQQLEKRPDLVSYKAYGVSELWWAIYEFNNIRDPFFDLKSGQILRIPAIERVLEAIDKLGT
jgi:hypothetical protein